MRTLLVVLAATTLACAAAAQERRSREGAAAEPARASGPVTLPSIPYDAGRPLAGVWEGVFTPRRGESVPFAVVIEYLNGSYQVYHLVNNMPNAITALSARVSGDSITWESRNSGGGFLVYTAGLNGRNALNGIMTFREFEPLPEHRASPPTFTLRRRGAR